MTVRVTAKPSHQTCSTPDKLEPRPNTHWWHKASSTRPNYSWKGLYVLHSVSIIEGVYVVPLLSCMGIATVPSPTCGFA